MARTRLIKKRNGIKGALKKPSTVKPKRKKENRVGSSREYVRKRGMRSKMARENVFKGKQGFQSLQDRQQEFAKAQEEAAAAAACAIVAEEAAEAAATAAAAAASTGDGEAGAAGRKPLLHFVNLINKGRNCWANTLIQVFMRMQCGPEAFRNLDPASENPLFVALRKFALGYSLSDGTKKISSSPFMEAIFSLQDTLFERGVDNDPLALFDVILSHLEEAGQSKLPDMCRIHFIKQFVCGCGCGNKYDIPFHLHWLDTAIRPRQRKIPQLISNYQEKTTLTDYTCEKTNKVCRKCTTVQTDIAQTGNYLIVKLVRPAVLCGSTQYHTYMHSFNLRLAI